MLGMTMNILMFCLVMVGDETFYAFTFSCSCMDFALKGLCSAYQCRL